MAGPGRANVSTNRLDRRKSKPEDGPHFTLSIKPWIEAIDDPL
jgi:hypothetical protein